MVLDFILHSRTMETAIAQIWKETFIISFFFNTIENIID